MFTVREKCSPAHFGPFLVQICPFLVKNQYFGLYLPSGPLNFADFWYRNLYYGLLLENWGLGFWKNLALSILGPFWSKFALFGPPQRGWGIWFSLRPAVGACVRSFVRQRSQNPFIGFFLFLAQSWGFLMRRRWHFRILPEKSRLADLGQKMAIFGQKLTFRPISWNLVIGSS